MDTANNFVMNINDKIGGGLALPFLRRPEARKGLPIAKKMNRALRAHLVAFLGELVGTFLFLFFGFAGLANSITSNLDDQITPALYTSIAFGFALLVNAWAFFRVSGGLFNPAVTWGLCLIGALSWSRGVLIFIAQMLGAILAGAFVKGLFPDNIDVRTSLVNDTTIAQGLFLETIMTLQLVLVIFLLAAEKHKATFLAPVGIGLALFIGMLASIRATGASMNPARSFGPSVTYPGFYSYHWIYWLGPLLGSTIAVIIYKMMKWLEYETANPGQDDTGEETITIPKDGSSGMGTTSTAPELAPGSVLAQRSNRSDGLLDNNRSASTTMTYSTGPYMETGLPK